jgi:hypothetical protein
MHPALESIGESIWQSARSSGFSGSDPYDGLRSRILCSLTSRSMLARAAAIQLVRRSPLDLRRILGIRPGRNPKALALFLRSASDRPGLPGSAQESTRLQDALLSLASEPGGAPALSPSREVVPGLTGRIADARGGDLSPALGWGYDFPWQGKAFYQPAYSPTAVVTSFVVDAFEGCGSRSAGYVASAAGRFVHASLRRFESPDGICFSYSPGDSTRVYNASLLAARILVSAARHDSTAGPAYRLEAAEACRFVVSRQAPDGSWQYGDGPEWSWTDGFHTGFVLQSLAEISAGLGTDEWIPAVKKGLAFYRDRLFDDEGTARTAPDKAFPLDPHSFAQGALTFLATEDIRPGGAEFACRILGRAADLLWDDRRKGFIYSRGRLTSNRAIHLRWSQAWMLRAICAFQRAEQGA